MNVEFFHARSIRPRDFACSATFGAAPYSTGERKPHIQTLRKTPKFPGNRIRRFGTVAQDFKDWFFKDGKWDEG